MTLAVPARASSTPRRDLPDRMLIGLIAVAAALTAAYLLLLQPRLPEAWRTPGSPELYIVGVAGALLLLVSMVFVVVKRGGGNAQMRGITPKLLHSVPWRWVRFPVAHEDAPEQETLFLEGTSVPGHPG